MSGNGGRGSWTSKTGFLLATIGSAIGLGNFWRFPYIAYKNGSGAYIIAYIVVLFLAGIPMMCLELGLGNKYKGSTPLVFAKIRKNLEWFGWWPSVLLAFGIIFYYAVILAWCFDYLFYSFKLSWGSNTGDFFLNKFLGLTTGPFEIGGFNPNIIGGLVITWFLIWIILFNGISKGIELANRFFMPLLFLAILILLVWSCSLEGAWGGIVAYLKPDFPKLLSLSVWTDAFVQMFFSLGIGMGIMITYSSYASKDTNVNDNAFIVCIVDAVFAIVAGLIVFATLGYMSHTSGQPINQVVRGGAELAFVVYPEAINNLPFGANIYAIVFFLSLIFAGLASAISVVEQIICSVVDKYGTSRKKAVNIFVLIGFAGGLIFCSGAGLHWLEIVDHFLNRFGLIAIAFVEAIIVSRIINTDDFIMHINDGSVIKMGRFWKFLMRYPMILILGVFLITSFYHELFTLPFGGYSWLEVGVIGFGWLAMTGIIAYAFTYRRWKNNIV